MVSSCQILLDSELRRSVELIPFDTTQRSVPPPRFAVRALYALRRLGRYVAAIEQYRPDAVLLFSAVGFSFIEKSILGIYARLRGMRVLLFLRGGPFMDHCRQSPLYRGFARRLLVAPHRLLCQGPVWQDFFVESLGIPRERCPIVPNWTASDRLLEIGAGRRYEQRAGVRILFIGWLDAGKGVPELLEAFRLLIAQPGHDDVSLEFAGEGNQSAVAREWATKHALESRVRFHGWVDGLEKENAFAAADLFVLPSHAEGLPNAMIEAMACGLPVVVTPVGAVPDVIQDGENGLLVPVRDVDALAAALGRLAGDVEFRERLGRAAHVTALEEFRIGPAATRLADVIYEVTDRPLPSRSEPGVPLLRRES